jgi:hypothetical protein
MHSILQDLHYGLRQLRKSPPSPSTSPSPLTKANPRRMYPIRFFEPVILTLSSSKGKDPCI